VSIHPGAPRSTHPGWRRAGDSLVRELEFRDFSDALAFVERIASTVEDHLRRPDMCILSYNRVRLTIGNPHHAGLTAAEMRLAEKVNRLIDPESPGGNAARRASP
jgi:4a-hydroxytetrahydrobiopterin dehydratase